MQEYLKSAEEVLREQAVTKEGLTKEEAAERLEKYGKNKLREGKKEFLILRFLKQLKNPMILILIAAAVISGLTAVYAKESAADVIIILGVVLINAVLGMVQESRAERAIAALQEMTVSVSKVIRNGHPCMLHSEELVPGDILVLEAGDSVPADGRIIECAGMRTEEAALTGESAAVVKKAEACAVRDGKELPVGDRTNMIYMGSSVVYGRGKAIITGTGMNTELGKIAESLEKTKESITPLQLKLNKISGGLSVLVIMICAAIFGMNVWSAYPQISGKLLLDTFMTAVSLAVAAIPEGLAAVVTIVLSFGVTKMSKKNAVIRKLTAVEALGCAQVICSDKTGTLTQNKMTVTEQAGDDRKLLAKAMALCSDAECDAQGNVVGEPTECALVNYASGMGLTKAQLEQECPRQIEAPFDSERKMMSTVHLQKDGTWIQYTKGAPDEVLKRCTYIWKNGREKQLTIEDEREILEANKNMAGKALRVLAAAQRSWKREPESIESAYLEQKLTFIGLTGMMDPVRPEVKGAISECKRAGIRPVMITGDHKATAAAIAMELGMIENEEQVMTGEWLNEISEEQLISTIERYSVYARVQPEHKVRIVNAWKKKGKITAMTGDGVNDAPALKNADIGVGMGINGTDVTKNVADMVLADDNFATIVSAVEEGRRIYDNIRKAIQFLLASNLSEVLAIFFATLLGFTILKPAHLLWINLITDCFPALALGMEEGEENIMKRPPRNTGEGIFAGGMGFQVIFQGIVVMVITMVSYFVGHYAEAGVWELTDSPDGMTMAFLTLSMTEIFHSFNMRSLNGSVFKLKKQNQFLTGAMHLSFLCTTLVVKVPFAAQAFGFSHISLREYVVAVLLAVLIVPIVETAKILNLAT